MNGWMENAFWLLADAALPVTAVILFTALALMVVGRRRAALRDVICRGTLWLLLTAPLIGLLVSSAGLHWQVPRPKLSAYRFPTGESSSITLSQNASSSKDAVHSPATGPTAPSAEVGGKDGAFEVPLPRIDLPVPTLPKLNGRLTDNDVADGADGADGPGKANASALPQTPVRRDSDVTRTESPSVVELAATPPTSKPIGNSSVSGGWAVLRQLAVVVWMLGVTIGMLHWLAGRWRLSWLVRRAYSPTQPLPNVEQWQIGRRQPPVLQSDRIRGPAVAGVVRPVILLPSDLLMRASESELAMALRHECAHVARRDPWTHAACRVATTLWWMHPLVWWFQRQVRHTAEEVCDNHVLENSSRIDYAESLLSLAAKLPVRGLTAPGPAMFSAITPLESRVRRLLDDRTSLSVYARPSQTVVWTIVVMLLVVAMGMGRWRPPHNKPDGWSGVSAWLSPDSRRRRRKRRAAAREQAEHAKQAKQAEQAEHAKQAKQSNKATPSNTQTEAPGRAANQEDSRTFAKRSARPELFASSLAMVPRNAVFYACSMNHALCWDRFRESRAFASLRSIDGLDELFADVFPDFAEVSDDELAEFGNLRVKASALQADLNAVGAEIWRHDVFVYADGVWESQESFSELGSQYNAWLERYREKKKLEVNPAAKHDASAKRANVSPSLAPSRVNEKARDAIQEMDFSLLKEVRFPALVAGCQLRDTETLAAANRLTRYLQLAWPELVAEFRTEMPFLDIRMEEVDDDTFFTVSVTGAMLPWHLIDRSEMSRNDEGKLDDLMISLSNRRLTLAMGVRQNYLLFSVGAGVNHLSRFGKADLKTRLVAHPELAPLRQARSSGPFTQLVFLADDWMRQADASAAVGDAVTEMLAGIQVNDQSLGAMATQVQDDLRELSQDIAKFSLPRSGFLLYQQLDEGGLSGALRFPVSRPYHVAHSQPPVLQHVGDRPLAVYAWEGTMARARWHALQKWTQRGAWYARRAALQADEGAELAYLLPRLLPPLRLLSQATTKLVDSLGDEGTALVLGPTHIVDGRPGASFQVVTSIAESSAFRRAMKEVANSGDELWRGYLHSGLADGAELGLPQAVPRPHRRDRPADLLRGRPAGQFYWYDLESLADFADDPADLRQPPIEDPWELSLWGVPRPHAVLAGQWLIVGTDSSTSWDLTRERPFTLPQSLALNQREQLTQYLQINTLAMYEHFYPALRRWASNEIVGGSENQPAPRTHYFLDDVQHYPPGPRMALTKRVKSHASSDGPDSPSPSPSTSAATPYGTPPASSAPSTPSAPSPPDNRAAYSSTSTPPHEAIPSIVHAGVSPVPRLSDEPAKLASNTKAKPAAEEEARSYARQSVGDPASHVPTENRQKLEQALLFYRVMACLESYTATEVRSGDKTIHRWRLRIRDLPR